MRDTAYDKVVIVTGASSGIGEATARLYASKGAKVMMAARNEKKLQQIEAELTADGWDATAVKCDVSIEEDCKNLVETTVKKHGSIDILISNAAVSMRALFRDLDLKVIQRLLDVNLWGTIYCTKYALPYLIESKGSLVGVSSIAGIQPLPARIGYSVSKTALHAFLNSIRVEHLRTGLHVLIFCPSFTASNIRVTALVEDGSAQGESPRDENKMMMPEEVANKLYRAIKGRRRFIVLTTVGKLTNLFVKFYPAWVEREYYKHFTREPDSPLEP